MAEHEAKELFFYITNTVDFTPRVTDGYLRKIRKNIHHKTWVDEQLHKLVSDGAHSYTFQHSTNNPDKVSVESWKIFDRDTRHATVKMIKDIL